MRVLLHLTVLCVILSLVSCQFRNQRNRNNRNNGRQQQLPRAGRQRNSRNNNNRGNNNLSVNNRRPKPSGSCRPSVKYEPNHRYQGRDVLISWRACSSKFTQKQAERFCRDNGMVAVSLDSRAKEDHFLGLVAQDRKRYFWTGGKMNLRNGSIRWPSGRRYNDVNWSNTGGADRPQPDNREGDEECLAVLNNFYADGIRFHDVSCHHKKPVICEAK